MPLVGVGLGWPLPPLANEFDQLNIFDRTEAVKGKEIKGRVQTYSTHLKQDEAEQQQRSSKTHQTTSLRLEPRNIMKRIGHKCH